MAIQQLCIPPLRLLRLTFLGVSVVFSLGGCALGLAPDEASSSLVQPRSTSINLVSSQEEQMLKEATDRALKLHAQLRDLEARNVSIVRRLPASTDPKIVAFDQRLASSRKAKIKAQPVQGRAIASERTVAVTEKLEPLTNFSVEFASGSSVLDETNRAALLNTLGMDSLGVRKIGGTTKTRILIQLSTHEKNGLDRLSRDRLKSITNALLEAGIGAEAVKLKARRVQSGTSEIAKGSASRLVRITKLEASAVRS
jgi:hypothetical protein